MASYDPDKEQRYRDRAQQLRAIAAGLQDEAARRTLLQAADEYELLAENVRLLSQHEQASRGS